MKRILGLDLGTNSIGWALIEQDFKEKQGKILGMGSRIIPMSADILGEFDKGNSISQTAARTEYRGIRRLRERHLLRRERLHRVLNKLGFLPEHYSRQIDFNQRLGQFIGESEPKLAYDNKKFIFLDSFEEMLEDFRNTQPELLNRKNKKGENVKVPYDWTIYYLRKKALSKKLCKNELAWLLLNFNQKRGYYQLRGEEDDHVEVNKLIEFHTLKVVNVIADDQPNKKGELWYSLYLENGWIYRRSSKTDLSGWNGKTRDFIVTTTLNDDGTVKTDNEGLEKRSFRAPSEDDWTLMKKKTEQEIEKSKKTVGSFIYDALLQKPDQKIRGKLIRTIERKYYKEELRSILKKQIELQPELFTKDLYKTCIEELYQYNEAHRHNLSKRDFTHLFIEDILFYQRPLKSKKSSIGRCSLEFRSYKSEDKEGNEIIKTEYLKALPKSHPLFQEFRVWQWLYNLKIYEKDADKDVTIDFIKGAEDIERLFEFLMLQKEIDHKTLLKHLLEPLKLKGKALNAEVAKYRWNYVYDPEKDESKKYPCNETGYEIRSRLRKVERVPENFLSPETEKQLWHIIYSVKDKKEYEKALNTFAVKNKLDAPSLIENLMKFKPFDSDFGSYSEKAIKKLLPLMRLGKYWNWDEIDSNTQSRIDKILTGEYDENIKIRVREKAILLTDKQHFQGLQLWLAQYIVYDRHSEAALAGKWKSVKDLEDFLENFKQHSLRNPIVEQVVTETLRVVKEIWVKYGKGSENFFHEIHIELGRGMKNTKEVRKRITNHITENENTNLRIKTLLAELKNDPSFIGVRPFSPSQQEALRIYEEYALNSEEKYNSTTKQFEHDPITDEIQKISRSAQPSPSELIRYKLWLEQRYRSPYTGAMIPLNKLFTEEYQIEHVIPQSRYFDDSLSNKVICESAVNQLKDRLLGLEFIKSFPGQKVETGKGNTVVIFTEEQYVDFVKNHYGKNRGKLNKLLLEEIPEKMIERQLNDTRYISKYISNLLSNLVRDERDDDGLNSKHIIPGNGKITSTLKKDWGLNDVWNEIVLPRFERMNALTETNDYTSKNKEGHLIPAIPLKHSKGFQKKRIDHRHHALDALVIACATRDHVNLLNNQSAKSDTKRFDLQHKLRHSEKWIDHKGHERDKFTAFKKPWSTFTIDTRNELEKIVVSFKQNLRVINKTTNKYESYKDEKGQLKIGRDGKPIKGILDQTKGDSWAIRKSLHKDTVSGVISLDRIKVPKGKILTATRKTIDTSFNSKAIESITDSGIQKILINHLSSDDEPKLNMSDLSVPDILAKRIQLIKNKELIEHPELAFSPEGLEEMNKNLPALNNGKSHHAIYKARIFETGSKFQLGQSGNKKSKYVEAAKGTNLFFAIYQDENGKRSYETIPLNIVIERQKQGQSSVPIKNEKGDQLLFHLSPNDLVYVPAEDEKENLNAIDFGGLSSEQIKRVFVVNDFSSTCYFTPNHLAKNIAPKEVDFSYDETKQKLTGSYDTKTASFEGEQIKEVCWKLKVDRLGNVSLAKN